MRRRGSMARAMQASVQAGETTWIERDAPRSAERGQQRRVQVLSALLPQADPAAFLSYATLYFANCATARVRLLSGALSSSRMVKWFAFAIGIRSPGR
jgi:hypothetical protein